MVPLTPPYDGDNLRSHSDHIITISYDLWFRTYNDSFVVASTHRQMAFRFHWGEGRAHLDRPHPHPSRSRVRRCQERPEWVEGVWKRL